MKFNANIKKIFLIGAVLLMGGSIGIYWVCDARYLRAPSDMELQAILAKNKVQFKQIHEMLIADAINYVRVGERQLKISEARQNEYVKLLTEVGASVVRSNGSTSKFIYASSGLSLFSFEWQKGIEYGEDACGREIDSLDDPSNFDVDMPYCRKIDGEWYLIFEKFS